MVLEIKVDFIGFGNFSYGSHFEFLTKLNFIIQKPCSLIRLHVKFENHECCCFRKWICWISGFKWKGKCKLWTVGWIGWRDMLMRWYLWGYPFGLFSNPTVQILNHTMSILTLQWQNKRNESHNVNFYWNSNAKMSCGHAHADRMRGGSPDTYTAPC